MRWTACSAMALTLLLSLADGPEATAAKRVRTDLHGDPLPPGAIARLGSVRLQHDDTKFNAAVQALVYSPDGKWLASAGSRGIIRLWDAESGKEIMHLEGHQNGIVALAFVPDGPGKPPRLLASSSQDRTIRIWDLKTGKERVRIKRPYLVSTLTVSPDDKLIASSSSDSLISFWNIENGQEIRHWKTDPFVIESLAFAPDGKTIASGGFFKNKRNGVHYEITVWQAGTGKKLRTLPGHMAFGSSLVFSADGKLLVSAGWAERKGRCVRLWDPQTGKLLRGFDKSIRENGASGIALTRDGKTLAILEDTSAFAIAAPLHRVLLFDTATGAKLWELPSRFARVDSAAFSPDGQTLATAEKNGRIHLWDLARRRMKTIGSGHVLPLTSVSIVPDGKTIVTTSDDAVWLWDRASGKPLRQPTLPMGPERAGVQGSACSPDGHTLALAHEKSGITFWDIQTGKLLRQIAKKNEDHLVTLAYSADGRWLATQVHEPTHVSLWDLSRGRLQRTFFARGRQLIRSKSLALSPDAKLVASTAMLGLHVWRTDKGKHVLLNKDNGSSQVVFSPGGILLAWTGYGDVELYDARTGTNLAHLNAKPCDGNVIAFSPDGRLIALADDRQVKLWDIFARRVVRNFEGQRGIISMMAFTPDGKSLVSASKDGTALIWDLRGVIPPTKGATGIQWQDLDGTDRLKVYTAFCRLRAAPKVAMSLLRKNLKPTPVVPAELLTDLIQKLDNDSFAVREQANQKLKKLGLAAEKTLRQAAQDTRSPETSRRIAQLLGALDSDADWQRSRIALKLLEDLHSPAARALLQDLTKGNPDSRLTAEAKAILQRIAKHGPEPKP